MKRKSKFSIWDFDTVCKDLFKAVYRADEGVPRKTDAALLDELIEIIQNTAAWAKSVSAEQQTGSASSSDQGPELAQAHQQALKGAN